MRIVKTLLIIYDYIIKPFNINELKARVVNLIIQRQRLREKFSKELDTFDTRSITVSHHDEQFLNKAINIVEQNMVNPDFGVKDFVNKMGMSRTIIFIKLKNLTGLPASQFIASIRLRAASRLLKEGKLNVSEVAYAIGFSEPAYFTKSFKKFLKKHLQSISNPDHVNISTSF